MIKSIIIIALVLFAVVAVVVMYSALVVSSRCSRIEEEVFSYDENGNPK